MSEKDFLPVESSRLSDFFPELKHFILANYSRTFTIKKRRPDTARRQSRRAALSRHRKSQGLYV